MIFALLTEVEDMAGGHGENRISCLFVGVVRNINQIIDLNFFSCYKLRWRKLKWNLVIFYFFILIATHCSMTP